MMEILRRRQSPSIPDNQVFPATEPTRRPNTFGLYNRMLTEIGRIAEWPASEELAMERAGELAGKIAEAPRKEQDQIDAAVIALRKHQKRLGRENGLPDIAERLLRQARGISTSLPEHPQ